MPKVSVIIPVYKAEPYIERCARSLFEQSIDDIEYLFIDDCSPDNSIKVLKRVLEDYPFRKSQVVIHRMEKNSGQAIVRTWGMKNFTGDYVTHCDSDDWVDLSAFEKMYSKAEEEQSDCVVCDYFLSDGASNNYIVKQHECDKMDYIRSLLLHQNSWSLCNKLFSRSVTTEMALKYPFGNMGEDMLLCSQFVLNSKKISFLHEAYYHYYRNSTSITLVQDTLKKYDNIVQLYNNTIVLIDVLESFSLNEELCKEIIRLKYYVKKEAMNICCSHDYYKKWRKFFPELDHKILFMNIKIKDKIKYYICLFGLGPFIHSVRILLMR